LQELRWNEKDKKKRERDINVGTEKARKEKSVWEMVGRKRP